MSVVEIIKKALKSKNLVVGYKSTMRLLKRGKASKIIVASNAPNHIVEELEHLSKIFGAEVLRFEKDNLGLGAVCRKPFGVSVLSIKSSEKK